MNVKSVFGTISDVLNGFGAVLTGLVGVGVMAQIIFGTGAFGIDVIGNITAIVSGFATGGLTGLLVLIVLLTLWQDK